MENIKLFISFIFFLIIAGYAYTTLEHTEILMHFDGGKSDKTFVDETGRVWTGWNGIAQSNISTPDGSLSSLLCNKSQQTFIETQDVSGLCPGTQNFRIEFHAKRNSINGTQKIMGNGLDDGLISTSTFQLSFTKDNKMELGIGNGTSYKLISSNSEVTDTIWHSYTIERDGQYVVFFKDGRFWGYNDIGSTFSLYDGSSPWTIGRAGGAEWDYFDGYIDEFRYSVDTTRLNTMWLDWYAYGDSNTAATSSALSPNDGSLCYIFTTIGHNSSLTADHCIAGYGMTSTWGAANVASYYPYPKNYIVMFGSNDMQSGISPTIAANNAITIYNYVTSRGSKCIILVPPLIVDDGLQYHNITYQRQWLSSFENIMQPIPHLKAYDALDTIPGDGIGETANTSYYLSDGKHLNAAGQAALGNFIWDNLADNFTASSTSGAT